MPVEHTGTPPDSPRFGAPRFSADDSADGPGDINAVTDAFDAAAANLETENTFLEEVTFNDGVVLDPETGTAGSTLTLTGRSAGAAGSSTIAADQHGSLTMNAPSGGSLTFNVNGSPVLTITSAGATAATQGSGDNSTKLATTAFVWAVVSAIAGGVSSVFGRSGAVAAQSGDYTVGQVTGAAPLASPTLTGSPKVPTAAPGTDTTQAASTAFVATAIAEDENTLWIPHIVNYDDQTSVPAGAFILGRVRFRLASGQSVALIGVQHICDTVGDDPSVFAIQHDHVTHGTFANATDGITTLSGITPSDRAGGVVGVMTEEIFATPVALGNGDQVRIVATTPGDSLGCNVEPIFAYTS